MSKFHRTQTQYKDRDCLVAALGEMGYTDVEVNEIAKSLYDYHGNKTTYLDAAGDKAEVIVRRQHIGSYANDLGFKFNPETKTYDAIISEYDSNKHNSTWVGHLTAKYAEKRAMKTVKALGFTLKTKPVSKNGKLCLEVVR